MTSTFAAEVEDWALRVQQALKVIFQESCQELVSQLNEELTEMVYLAPETDYRRTGFLRASLQVSATKMPHLGLDAPETDAAVKAIERANAAEIILVIAGAEPGDTLYLGYTANYSPFLHYGANGRPGRPWVLLTAQRWPQIVGEMSAKVKTALGL